jgi:putative alpha-1,2-mannosidase
MSRAFVGLITSLVPCTEISSVPTYLYNYVGQPVKTVDRVDTMIAKYYSTA